MRQLEGKSYRRFAEWLRSCRRLIRLLKLRRVPHYTMLQKFAVRTPSAPLDMVLRGFAEEADPSEPILGVDASGFKPSRASSYYARSLKPRRVKRYVKCTLAVELRSQLVCGFKARRLARHDLADFQPVLEKASLNPSVVVAGKGYDAEHAHEYVREGGRSWAPTPSYLRGVGRCRSGGPGAGTGRR